MIRALILTAIIFTLTSCKKNTNKFNKNLSLLLEEMAASDQVAAGIRQGKYKKLNDKDWKLLKDSIFSINQIKADSIFKEYGFVGYDLVGKSGSKNFWLIIQHSDHMPEFQFEVLKKMKIEVEKKNASPEDYAYLTDRVNLNTGNKQIYGTQVTYNWKLCQAYPKPIVDSLNINIRRKEVGLEPIEVYLNEMSKFHFEINKEIFKKLGIEGPQLYKTN